LFYLLKDSNLVIQVCLFCPMLLMLEKLLQVSVLTAIRFDVFMRPQKPHPGSQQHQRHACAHCTLRMPELRTLGYIALDLAFPCYLLDILLPYGYNRFINLPKRQIYSLGPPLICLP
jgi:hypothetical protein